MKKGLKILFIGLALLVSCGLFLACPNQTVTPEPTPEPAPTSAFPVTIKISKATDATKEGYGTIDVTGTVNAQGAIETISGTDVKDDQPAAASDKQVVVQIGDKKYRVQGTATVNNNSTSMALDVEGGFAEYAASNTEGTCSTENLAHHTGAIKGATDSDVATFADGVYTITFDGAGSKTYNIYKLVKTDSNGNGVWKNNYVLTLAADADGKVTPTFALPSAQAGE